jgi:RNA polymerase sigma-70 factor (ECF subfamily)
MRDVDDQIIRQVLAGDREGFRSLVTRHQSAVCAAIRALRAGYDDWEDLAQEVFLKAYQHLGQFDPAKGSLRTWLLAIARNQCRSADRRRVVLPAVRAIEPLDHRSPDLLATEMEWFARLDAALAALPDEQRLVFVLIEMQGLSHQEAAEIAETSVGTIKSRLFRAKEWLRETLRRDAIATGRADLQPHQTG